VVGARAIRLRGVSVHNLKQIDLDLPHHRLIVICGVSGSGKTSLALDTLYAEGQRRYIESFSAYTRQFLEHIDKPAAESIDGIPPAVAFTRKGTTRSSRSTVGTATEAADYLRLLFAKIGQIVCYGCGQPVRRDDPQTTAAQLAELPADTRLMVTFRPPQDARSPEERASRLKQEGFVRVLAAGRTIRLDGADSLPDDEPLEIVVDRLSGGSEAGRMRDSLEMAFQRGGGRCCVMVSRRPNGESSSLPEQIDGRNWWRLGYDRRLRCARCEIEYPPAEPLLFSFNSPLGACPECEGFGDVMDIDLDRIVPDPTRSLRDGAIAPWNTPAYAHHLRELLALAPDYGIPVDVPFAELTEDQLDLIRDGVPERDFGGLAGFFAWLERRKYKMHVRVFLSRWRSYRRCPSCRGDRLRPEALAVRIAGVNFAQVARLPIREARPFFASLQLDPWQLRVTRTILPQVIARLAYLEKVGLNYLTLDRRLRTLSGGEAQRVTLTKALGSSLVNMLYVLDEPSVGLHPQDVDRLYRSIRDLRDRKNTVVVVEHEEMLIRGSDQVVEIGPEAGRNGGRVVFQGTPAELEESGSLTGEYLAGRRGYPVPEKRRQPRHGRIRLAGAAGHNLQQIDVEFPLGLLCLVTGVSGAGKSTLVQDTLYPALCRRLRKESPRPLPYDDVFGTGQIEDVMLVDQSPIGRSPRSNPVTYVKAFDAIRQIFADTIAARTANFSASKFSFNVDGGRCSHCQGDGTLSVDMQFLADIYMKCPQCNGTRYRKEVLKIQYRNRSIADVLRMTVREAFRFFRGHRKVQARLHRLIDVGLDYLQLGQPANTLSGGEAQRLKLATYMSATRRGRTLFILDEPTTGLHFADIVKLLDCFDALIAAGHSLVVVEHNLQLMKAADYLIDLGPGAADEGGRVVACGSPEQVAQCPDSATGKFLRESLAAALAQ